MRRLLMLSTAVSAALLLAACSGSPAYVRGSDNPEIDEYAMSTGLDKKDLENLFAQNSKSLSDSGAMRRWKEASREGKEARIAIFPLRNETSEHIDSQLQSLLSDFETQLVNGGYVTVVSYENQGALVEEIKKQQSAAFNPDKAAQLGRQLGVEYFITGKVYDSAEKSGRERRVQYFLFMQVIEVETGAVRWQNKADLTKGFIN